MCRDCNLPPKPLRTSARATRERSHLPRLAVVTLPTCIVVTDGPSAHDRLAVLTQENLWRGIAGALLDSAVTSAAYRTGKEYSEVAGRHAETICEPTRAFGECLKNVRLANSDSRAAVDAAQYFAIKFGSQRHALCR